MGQDQSYVKKKGSGRKKGGRGGKAGKGDWGLGNLLNIEMVLTAIPEGFNAYTNFQNGRVKRREMSLNGEAFREGIPTVKCFLTALTKNLAQQNYLELISTFLMTMNTVATWVEVLQGNSALEHIGHKIHGELQAQTGLMAAKAFAEQVEKTIRHEANDLDQFYFLYHPDTDWHAEYFDRVKRERLPDNFLGLSENLDSIVVWMLFLRRHLAAKKKKAQFHLIIPAYRPMLIREPLAFPHEVYPLSIKGFIHDSKHYVWFNLPTIDDVPAEQLEIHHIGNLYRPSSTLEEIAAPVTFMAGGLLTMGATMATAVFAPPLAIPVWTAGAASTVAGANAVERMVTEAPPRVLGSARNADSIPNEGASDDTDAGEDFTFHATTRRVHRGSQRGNVPNGWSRPRRA